MFGRWMFRKSVETYIGHVKPRVITLMRNMSTIPELQDYYKRFPKVELHVHLDGSCRHKTLQELSKKHECDFPHDDENKFKDLVSLKCPQNSLNDFLKPFHNVTKLMSTSLEAIKRFAFEFVEDSYQHNVLYTEVRFSPHLLQANGKHSARNVVRAVLDGLDEGQRKFDVQARCILCAIKGELPEDHIKEVVALAVEFKDKGVVGIDIAGPEDHLFDPFIEHFQNAASQGIHITVHAGESGPAENVQKAIVDLKASRIGHGYNSVTDKAVMDLIRTRNVHLEGCPISSIYTSANSRDAFRKYVEEGVSFSLNSDDPGIMRTTLSHDYQKAVEYFGIAKDYLPTIVRNAAKASFLPQAERDRLLEKVEVELKKFNQ